LRAYALEGDAAMDLLDRLLEHDRWTTRQVLAICRALPPKQVQQPFGVGNGSLDATLRHMLGNIQLWTELMRTRPVQSWDAIRSANLEELALLFETLYADFADCARRLRDDDRLDDVYLDVLDDPPTPKTFGGTIAHVLTHNMHHRAELLHMLGQLGAPNLLEGDVLSWEKQARQGSQAGEPAPADQPARSDLSDQV
jgi:uncharacterized damage-inducible protein DinB